MPADSPCLTEKIQKVLARAGLGSRRQIETWIQNGRVEVNGRIATIGDRVSRTEKIRVDGRVLRPPLSLEREVLCYYKSAGDICTRHDPKGRSTIFEHLPKPKQGRWISVGRLDYNTAGLLLLTNDGELAHRLMHPSYTIEREYAVRVLGEVDEAMLKRLRDGVLLSDGRARFRRIVEAGGDGANHWYHVTLSEGRKHEVRRLWESQGVTVSRLMRIRFGPIFLPKGLRTGGYVMLDSQSEKALLEIVGLKVSHSSSSSRQSPKKRAKVRH
jgi:23S rRNA pseudouridine2605 synthase